MKALTAKGVRYNPRRTRALYGKFELFGQQEFTNCEVYPYFSEWSAPN